MIMWKILAAIGMSIGVLWAGPKPKPSEVTMQSIFTDNMVLQREVAVPIWGTAPAGTKVTVTFGQQKKTVETQSNGKWMLKLDPMSVNAKPSNLDVTAGAESLAIKNILVGDVYLCGGQSNMEVKMKEFGRPEDVKVATFPKIRYYDNISKDSSTWNECTPESVLGCSAVGFYFARRIHQETNLPIGLICNAVGSSRIERWIPEEGYAFMPDLLSKSGQPIQKAWDKYGSFFRMHTQYIVPFAIKSMIWYQGEQNIWNNDSEKAYATKMKALIGGLRKLFNVGDFPVYFVQLPCMGKEDKGPGVAGGLWTGVQMAQRQSLDLANTGMVVALDLNTPPNIHPANKVDVGERLALWALAKDYGKKDLVTSGPLYREMKVEGNKARISFDYAEKGLMAGTKDGYEPVKEVTHDKIQMFAIAGEEESQESGKKALKWFAGDAVIDGNDVVVSSPQVKQPIAVRYAYGNAVFGPMLYNKAGLPASPFESKPK